MLRVTSEPTPPSEPVQAGPPAGEAGAAAAPEEPRAARRWGLRRTQPAPAKDATPADDATPAEADGAAAVPETDEAVGVIPSASGPRRLRRDRRRLLSEREEAVYHLGGLAFELYRRDQLSDGVMRLRAGEVAKIDDTVRDIDARLSEVERERRERRHAEPADPAFGCCLVCRTPFRAEARFCWQCGTQVVPPPVGGDDQPTAVISSPGPA
jgi:hypothetical protein